MESFATQIAHWLTLTGVCTIIGMLVHQHKVWVRMKDRINTLWYHHCVTKSEPYVPLDNGRR